MDISIWRCKWTFRWKLYFIANAVDRRGLQMSNISPATCFFCTN